MLEENKKVSVIMGVYNGMDTLKEAIESIINQTYSNWELIVCDDQSTDESLSTLKTYALKDNRIKVITNSKNSGLAASLNHCLKYVSGTYIARMDADDLSVPERLEKQVEFLEKNPEINLVGTEMQEFSEKGYGDIVKNKKNPTKYDVPKGAPFCHATIMIRTQTMRNLGGYRISKHTMRTEDVDLWYRFFAGGYKGENIEERGMKVFDSIKEKLFFKEMDVDTLVSPYADSRKSVTPHPNRKKFFKRLNKSMGWKELYKAKNMTIFDRVRYKIYRTLNSK